MYKIAYAAVQGRSHSEKNIPCQDKVLSLVKNDVTVLTLADGAGSAKYSDIGAEIIVKQINQLLGDNFKVYYEMDENKLKKELSSSIIYTLLWEVSEKNILLKDLSSTLLFVAADNSNYLIGHIGDGMIGYMRNEETEIIIDVLSYPAKGEFYNSTFFTTVDELHNHIRIYKGSMKDIEGFMLMSDGGDDVLFDRQENKFSPAVQTLFDWITIYSEEKVSLALFKNMKKHFRLKTYDDCSVGILRKTKAYC